MRTDRRWLATGLLMVAALVMAGCGSSSSTSSTPAPPSSPGGGGSGTGIKTASTSIGTVLTNSKGFTVYWFKPDTRTKSNCNGACAKAWPPVHGPVSAAAGVSLPGRFGTIKRADGTVQATYDGHPLYTYSGDTAPGQTTGNGIGGIWHAVTTGAGMPGGSSRPSSSPSSSGGGGGGGGYGY